MIEFSVAMFVWQMVLQVRVKKSEFCQEAIQKFAKSGGISQGPSCSVKPHQQKSHGKVGSTTMIFMDAVSSWMLYLILTLFERTPEINITLNKPKQSAALRHVCFSPGHPKRERNETITQIHRNMHTDSYIIYDLFADVAEVDQQLC